MPILVFAQNFCDRKNNKLAHRAQREGISLKDTQSISDLYTYFVFKTCESLDQNMSTVLSQEIQKIKDDLGDALAAKKQKQKALKHSDMISDEIISEIKLKRFQWKKIPIEISGSKEAPHARQYILSQNLCQVSALACKVRFDRDGSASLWIVEPVLASFQAEWHAPGPPKMISYEFKWPSVSKRRLSGCPNFSHCSNRAWNLFTRKKKSDPLSIGYRLSSFAQDQSDLVVVSIPEPEEIEKQIREKEQRMSELEKTMIMETSTVYTPMRVLFILNVCSYTIQRGASNDFKNALGYAFSQIQEVAQLLPPGSTFKIAITSVEKEWPSDHVLSSRFLDLGKHLELSRSLLQHNQSIKDVTMPGVITHWMSTMPRSGYRIPNTLSEGVAPILDDMKQWSDQPELIVSFTDGYPWQNAYPSEDVTLEDREKEKRSVQSQTIPMQFKPIGSLQIEPYFREIPRFPKDKVLSGEFAAVYAKMIQELRKEIVTLKSIVRTKSDLGL